MSHSHLRMINAVSKLQIVFLQGVSTMRRSVTEEKQNSYWNLKILPDIGGLGKFSGRHKVMTLNFEKFEIFGEWLPEICDNITDFWEDFYFHRVLLKQHLLGLSVPVILVRTFFSYGIRGDKIHEGSWSWMWSAIMNYYKRESSSRCLVSWGKGWQIHNNKVVPNLNDVESLLRNLWNGR